jgi:glycosidase
VAGLGCGGILLTPVFVSMTHGYDSVDCFRIDQRMGDETTSLLSKPATIAT